MKKKIFLLSAIIALLISFSSCSNEKENYDENAKGLTGNLTISLGFKDIPKSRASQSDKVIPITTWDNNIKSMLLLLTDGGIIRKVLPITLDNKTDNSVINRTFNGLPAKTYDVYIIANYDQNTTPFGAGSVTATPSMSGTSLLGASINGLLLNLPNETPTDLNVGFETKIVGEPAEIFLAKQGGIKIEPDVTTNVSTPFALTRAVSLLRIRINKVHDISSSANVDNSSIDFINGTIRLRRHGLGLYVATAAGATTPSWGVDGITPTSASTDNIFYSKKTFKTEVDFKAPNYQNGADMKLDDLDFTLWNEYLILPGGNDATGPNSGETKFNLVLSGKTTNTTYIPADRTTPVGANTTVYWTGQITGSVAPNGILELNITPKTAGSTILPEVEDYGNLSIDINLVDWTNTKYVDLPI